MDLWEIIIELGESLHRRTTQRTKRETPPMTPRTGLTGSPSPPVREVDGSVDSEHGDVFLRP